MKSIRNMFLLTILILSGLAGFAFADLINFDHYNKLPQQQNQVNTNPHQNEPTPEVITVPELDSFFEVDPNQPIPVVRTEIVSQSADGVLLKLHLINFTPAGELDPEIPLQNQGFAQLHINGSYISKVYSELHFVPRSQLQLGNNQIEFKLATQSGEILMLGGESMKSVIELSI